MPTAIQMQFQNLGLDDYDRVCEALDFPSDWPDGLLAHGASEEDGKLRVVDIWDSPETYDRFVEERLGPAIGQALGDRAEQPQRKDVPLHTFYAGAPSG